MDPVAPNTTAIAQSYTRLGLTLVPFQPGAKGPTGVAAKGWQLRENCIGEGQIFPQGMSIGLAHAYSRTCSIDIDDMALALQWGIEKGIDITGLLEAADAVQICSGIANHGKLIYRLPDTNPTLPTVTHSVNKRHVLQFRCSTRRGTTMQDVLPPSIHPDTQKPYYWGGKGDFTQIPLIPEALLRIWLSLLEVSERIEPKGNIATSEAEVESALAMIDPDVEYDTWVKIGMAVHAADPALYHLFEDWSSNGSKYAGSHDTESKWHSFSEQPGGISPLSLFKYARESGWQGYRRPADEVFKPIDMPSTSIFEGFIHSQEQILNHMDHLHQSPPPGTADPLVYVDPYWAEHDMSQALATPVDPIETLVPGLIPMRGLTGLVGAAGHGKSNFMLDLAWAMTTGGCLFRNPSWPARQGTCYILEAEDDVDEARRRLQDLGKHDEPGALVYGQGVHKIYFHNPAGSDLRVTDRYGNPTKFVDDLIAKMKACPQKITCLLVGPLINLSGGSESNEDTQSTLRELERVGREVGCSVIVPHHVSKSSAQNTERTEHAARGGGSFNGTVRAQLHIQNMGLEEAAAYRIPVSDRNQWVGLTLVKANGMRPIPEPVWLKRNPNSATMAWTSAQPEAERKLTTKDSYIHAVRRAKDMLIAADAPWPARAFSQEYGGRDGIFDLGWNKLYALLTRACEEGLLASEIEVGGNGKRSRLLLCGQAQRGETILMDTEAGVVFAGLEMKPVLPDFLT